MKQPDVRAAGAVVLRREADETEVLVVHRPRYDDWSLPKGKLDKGETDAACAAREVAEETGVRVRLTAPLSPHRYRVQAGLKQVDWWLAEAYGEPGDIQDVHEVDQTEWLPVSEAIEWLSYSDERDRLMEAVALPPVTPLVIVRHAKALPRKLWAALDSERPITDWGRRQSRALIPFLTAFGIRRVVSSSATRCLQTVNPYARALALPLEGWRELTEETSARDPDVARVVAAELAVHTARNATATVVCGHRPVLPAMLEGVGAPPQPFATAEALVVALTNDGTPVTSRSLVQRIGR
ncbi:NUDIX hydrolase [Granulicoccus sp. GXG6511]|uniref:NUDIX hydrolase n=1 Tax=Granulicoccus sp. GXG6511 TaxID=3381351 RepID=UPI003D7D92B5